MGQSAAASHTAAAAGPLVSREALFGQAGVIATGSFGELLDATAGDLDTGGMVTVTTFKARPLTGETWPDLERLFGLPGGSIVRGCWCMYYRRTGQREGLATGQWKEQNKQELRELAERDLAPGLVGYLDGEPAGWISLGPRDDYLRLRRSRVMKPVDDTPVWSVICSYVAKPYRGQGLQHRLLAAGIAFARDHGATVLEAYPVDKAERSHDDFMFFGSRSLFERAGFQPIERRSATRLVMRLDLRGPG